jgi:hypothetical protein
MSSIHTRWTSPIKIGAGIFYTIVAGINYHRCFNQGINGYMVYFNFPLRSFVPPVSVQHQWSNYYYSSLGNCVSMSWQSFSSSRNLLVLGNPVVSHFIYKSPPPGLSSARRISSHPFYFGFILIYSHIYVKPFKWSLPLWFSNWSFERISHSPIRAYILLILASC